MTDTTSVQTYPFDPTGTNPLNLVPNEQQVVTAVNYNDYHFVIPRFAPFFKDGLVLTFTNPDGSARPLVEGQDYLLANFFISASRACAAPIFGAISFLDFNLAGVIRMSYQTLGGIWTLDDNGMAELLANEINNPRVTAWEQVTNIPVMFPVISHEWDLVDMVGASEVVTAIQNVADAIVGNINGQNAYAAHLVDYNNPHETTAAQVGLGNVQNFPLATPAQAQAGTNNTTYMTPFTTNAAIQALGAGAFTAHLTNYNNPHQTTAAQVGLGSVLNYGVADGATALAGVSSTTYMTPATTAAVVAAGTASFTGHIADHNNPHQTNAFQIGLGNVQNYPIAGATDAQAGSSNVMYMTPLRTAQAISLLAGVPLTTHINDQTNPHQVSKSQVGLGNVDNFSTGTISDSQNNTLTNKFMTPLTTYNAIQFFVGTAFIAHENATNPHNVNAAQVGLGNVQNYSVASNADAVAGTATNLYMTPATTAAAIAGIGVNGTFTAHLTDYTNPHHTTAAQIGLGSVQNYPMASTADAQAGTSSALYMSPLATATAVTTQLTPHLNDHTNPHATTASQVGLGLVQNYPVANDTQAIDSSNGTTYMTPHTTSVAIATYVNTSASNSVQVEAIRSYIANTSGTVLPNTWFKLGTLGTASMPSGGWATDEIANAKSDLHWLVAGGEGPGAPGAIYLVHCSLQGALNAQNNPVYLTIRPLTENASNANNFGYTWDNTSQTVTLYLKTANGSNPISVVNINKAGIVYGDGTRILSEPSGITYMTALPGAPDSQMLGGLPASSYVLQTDFNQFVNDMTAKLNAIAVALNATP